MTGILYAKVSMMRKNKPAGMPAIPGQKKKTGVMIVLIMAMVVLFLVIIGGIIIGGYVVFDVLSDNRSDLVAENQSDTGWQEAAESYYLLQDVPYFAYTDDDDWLGDYEADSYVSVDQIAVDEDSSVQWLVTTDGVFIRLDPDVMQKVVWTECDLYDPSRIYCLTRSAPLYYSEYMIGSGNYDTADEGSDLVFDRFMQDNTGRVAGLLDSGVYVVVQDAEGSYIEEASNRHEPVTYAANYTVKVRQEPDRESRKIGTVQQGSLVSIIDTKQEKGRLWGKMSDGGWICIYDENYTYLSEY